MPGNSFKRALKRDAAKAGRKAAIAEQYGLPANAVANSRPESLGRSMFLSRSEAKKFSTAFGKARRGEGIPEHLKQKSKEGNQK